MTNTLYFDKEVLKDKFLRAINTLDKDSIYTKEILKLTNKLKSYLEKTEKHSDKRFIEIKDSDVTLDLYTKCLWPNLFGLQYKKQLFDSGTSLQEVEKTLPNGWDIPTEDELYNLYQLSNTPFGLSYGRPSVYPQYEILCKKENKVQGIYVDNDSYWKTRSSGAVFPIYTLKDEKEILIILLKYKVNIFNNDLFKSILSLNPIFKNKKISNIKNIDNLKNIKADKSKIIEDLRYIDKTRANLREYDTKMFVDIHKGSWELYEKSQQKKDTISITLDEKLCARDPQDDITGGIVGIDFGTKSTVVVASKDSEDVLPLRVGIGNWSKDVSSEHYENPTVMEFIDFNSFLNDYYKTDFRPYTKYKDLTISHTAYENLTNSNSEDFNAYLTELKQWAGDKNKKLKIKDKKKKNVFELKSFLELKNDDINPIEIYTYYLGLYINNQYNGIYLKYILSFPVTYEKSVRAMILKSFERGLKRSLPDIKEKIKDLEVIQGASEPAAYAAIALQKYGLDENERNFYAIFDFGGGTTDFDFGVFRCSDEDNKAEERFDYVIEHFGAGGDKFLGGENLLELLAFEVFKKNQQILRKEQISFELPPECKEFLGSEVLLNDSREARLNMVNLIGKLRAFWEREDFSKPVLNKEIKVDLYNNNGELKSQISLKVDENELKKLLENRIKKGVDSFFEGLREVFANYQDEIDLNTDTIHIFLAGNSSKSPLVKTLFDVKIASIKKDLELKNYKGEFKLYPPLDNKNNFEEPNGKTGVAFGLIESRPGGNILVINKNLKEKDEIKFKYYLGRNRRKKFKVILPKETPYNKWIRFIDAGQIDFEVYYTSLASATTNSMSIKDSSIKRKSLKIKQTDTNKDVYIRFVNPTIFEYGIGSSEKDVKVCGKVEI